MGQEIDELRELLSQKENVEIFFGEAIERSKQEIQNRESRIEELTQIYDREKELRIKLEEQSNILRSQMQNEGSMINQSQIYERLDQMQNEKAELMNSLQALKTDKIDIED